MARARNINPGFFKNEDLADFRNVKAARREGVAA